MAGVVGMGGRDSPHMQKRLLKRDFTEIGLRRMMERASDYALDRIDGRWVIRTRFRRKTWEVIVEPLAEEKKLEVVTAYEVWDD